MRLWTDFNYMEHEDRVWADLDEAESYFEQELIVGQRVQLFDGLGYECIGTIVTVDLANRMVELELDRATWRSTKHSGHAYQYSARYDAEFASKYVSYAGAA
jgi:hypothetical protein